MHIQRFCQFSSYSLTHLRSLFVTRHRSLSLTISHSLTHCHALSLYYHSLSLTISHSLTATRYHILSLTITILSLTVTHYQSHSLTHSLSRSLFTIYYLPCKGASGETRRLTYAWRLRHLCKYNASRQKMFADVLEFLIIFFTFVSTLVSVFYSFIASPICSDSSNPQTCKPNPFANPNNLSLLAKLCLGLPLLATIFRGEN